MDTAAPSTIDRTPIARGFVLGLYGAVVAILAWWLIDELATQRLQRFAVAAPAIVPLLEIALVAVIGTAALLSSRIALATAAIMAVGIVLGGYGSRTPLVTLPSDDLQFTLLRGAYEPAIWALGGVWLLLAVSRFFRIPYLPHR